MACPNFCSIENRCCECECDRTHVHREFCDVKFASRSHSQEVNLALFCAKYESSAVMLRPNLRLWLWLWLLPKAVAAARVDHSDKGKFQRKVHS